MAQNVICMVFYVFDIDLDMSRSFDFCAFTIFPCMTGVIFERICSLWVEIYNIEIWKNSLYLIMGIFRCHGNVRYVFLIDAIFCKVHSIGPSNMCINFETNRLRIDDFRKSEKIVYFLWRHVAQKRDVVRQIWGSRPEAPIYKERSPSNQKSLRLPFQKLWHIIWFLQKWWPWPWSLSDFHQKNLPGSLELSTSAVKFFEISDQWCGLYIVQLRTDKQTYRQTNRQTDRQMKGTQRVRTLRNRWIFKLKVGKSWEKLGKVGKSGKSG